LAIWVFTNSKISGLPGTWIFSIAPVEVSYTFSSFKSKPQL
jgi:hypothetical protein